MKTVGATVFGGLWTLEWAWNVRRRSIVCHVAGGYEEALVRAFQHHGRQVIRAVMSHKVSMDTLPHKYGASVPAYRW